MSQRRLLVTRRCVVVSSSQFLPTSSNYRLTLLKTFASCPIIVPPINQRFLKLISHYWMNLLGFKEAFIPFRRILIFMNFFSLLKSFLSRQRSFWSNLTILEFVKRSSAIACHVSVLWNLIPIVSLFSIKKPLHKSTQQLLHQSYYRGTSRLFFFFFFLRECAFTALTRAPHLGPWIRQSSAVCRA